MHDNNTDVLAGQKTPALKTYMDTYIRMTYISLSLYIYIYIYMDVLAGQKTPALRSWSEKKKK